MRRKKLVTLISSVCLVLVLAALPFMAACPAPVEEEGEVGGILKIIYTAGPQVLSYVPLMGPGDHTAILPCGERLVDTTFKRQVAGGVEPVLCEDVDVDVENLTITWHIREGVKFHDGSDLNAEVVRWNIQQCLDAKVLPYASYLKEMRITDEYTLVMDLYEYSNQLVPTWGWWPVITSKAAWDAAGTTDEERIKWARTHIVSTGPFILEEFKRDVSITWVRNPDYWREGRPYLDGIEVTFIPDPVTARAMFEAGEVDAWNQPPAKDQRELSEQGYTLQSSWPALGFSIWINTAHPDSKWQDKNLREAVEYALDKEAITEAMGFGLYRPLTSLPPEGEWGYDPAAGRPYDPELAKELLADSGYSTDNPLQATLLSMNDPVSIDVCTMIKSYLDAVGFEIELDPADPGRFFGTIYWAPPGPDLDLHWWITGRDTNYLQTYMRWFSTEPFTDLSYLLHTAWQAESDVQAMAAIDLEEQEAWCGELVGYIMDNAFVIPVYDPPAATIQQPYVHSTQYEQGFVRWQTEEIWMEPH
ncbi:hypothetical protein ES703_89127 [subsurface metagenome]